MKAEHKVGDHVLIDPDRIRPCAGTILEPLDSRDFDGEWLVASAEHNHAVARYEWELLSLENPNTKGT